MCCFSISIKLRDKILNIRFKSKLINTFPKIVFDPIPFFLQNFLAEENKGLGLAYEFDSPSKHLAAAEAKGPMSGPVDRGTGTVGIGGSADGGTPLARTPMCSGGPGSGSASSVGNVRNPQMIQFGKYDINTWYSSPYPQVSSVNRAT